MTENSKVGIAPRPVRVVILSIGLIFAKGASLEDPAGLFNSGLEGGTRRAIDIHEGTQVDAGAFKALVKAAVAQNAPPAKQR